MCLFFLLTSIVNVARCNRTPNYASPTSCNGSPQSWQALSRNNASKMPIMQRKSTHSPLRIAAHPKLTAVNGRETSFVPTFHITSVALSLQISSGNEARIFPLHCFVRHTAPFLCSQYLSRCSPYRSVSSFSFHLFFLCHLGLSFISFLLLTASQFAFTSASSSSSYFYTLFPRLISWTFPPAPGFSDAIK